MNLIFDDFNILVGNLPIILSAPHCCNHFRNGKIKTYEYNTDTLVISTSNKIGTSCIYKTAFSYNDPNWDSVSNYKNELKNFILQNNVKFLLDVHGMAAERECDICIGTGFFNNICGRNDILDQLVCIFKDNGFKNVFVDKPFSASGHNVISSYISSECSIPCFQIEINNRFRNPIYDEYNLNFLIDVFIQVVDFLKKDL